MSSLYNPDGTIPAPTTGANTAVQVATSTNPSGLPVVITTSTPHGFNSGDTVEIEGHTGNAAMPLLAYSSPILVSGASAFKLLDVIGNGGATGTDGQVIDYSITPQFTIPSDGDALVASSVNPAISGLANFEPFAYRRMGKYRLYSNVFATYAGATPFTTYLTSALASPGSNTFIDLVGTGTITTMASLLANPLPVVDNNDMLDISFTSSFNMSGTTVVAVAFALAFSDVGTGGVNTTITQSSQVSPLSVPSAGIVSADCNLSLFGHYQFSSQQQNVNVGLQIFVGGGYPAGVTLTMLGGYTLVVRHWRQN